MKISELLDSYSNLVKNASVVKKAFVPNPAVAAPQAAPQQQQPPQILPPGAQMAQPGTQQAAPPPPPPQAAQPPAPDDSGLISAVMQTIQKLPPQLQQQIGPALQQLVALPPQQRAAELTQLLQQLQGAGAAAPAQQGGMIAQAASAEDLYAAMQGMQPGGDMPQEYAQQDDSQADAEHAEASAIEAKNQLDNVKVELTVRELLDLVGKGSATASLLKVKQLADTHKQKMEQTRQKAEAAKQQSSQEQQAQQQGMMGGGGIYPTPMGA